ncbi:MAG: hypothetical protein HOV94_22520 [Saccharothrix sp.]|nr:hypothetical protein [Saccharothrix sp.]
MALVERFVLGIDIKDSSVLPARVQKRLYEELDRMLDEASARVGLDRSQWVRQPGGDGETAVLPPDVDLAAMVGDFVLWLDRQLTDHNDISAPTARLRLRVAMHTGALTPSAFGFAGPALVTLRRLLDSTPVRAALDDAPAANLAQIISESLFHKAVTAELAGLRPRGFRQVEVDVKTFHEAAYVHVPGGPHPPPPPRPRPPRDLGALIRAIVTADPPPARLVEPEPEPEPQPVDEPVVVLGDDVLRLLDDLDAALADHAWERADALTTTALLVAAGRVETGWLRSGDGTRLTDRLLTELDRAWSRHSGGAWGFRAQRERSPKASTAGYFRSLSTAFGWRADNNGTDPPYAEFGRRAVRARPFYPTLRNPNRERFPEWHDEWSNTVVATHRRLRNWEW